MSVCECTHAEEFHDADGRCRYIDPIMGAIERCACTRYTAPTETVSEGEDYPWASQILSQKIAEKFDQQPAREQALADAEAAWGAYNRARGYGRSSNAHPLFIAGYLAGKGIDHE